MKCLKSSQLFSSLLIAQLALALPMAAGVVESNAAVAADRSERGVTQNPAGMTTTTTQRDVNVTSPAAVTTTPSTVRTAPVAAAAVTTTTTVDTDAAPSSTTTTTVNTAPLTPAPITRPSVIGSLPPGATCPMPVNPALHAEYNGRTFHFCSPDCMEMFTANPSRYVAAPAVSDPPDTTPIRATTVTTPAGAVRTEQQETTTTRTTETAPGAVITTPGIVTDPALGVTRTETVETEVHTD